jgi:hypothetical protein
MNKYNISNEINNLICEANDCKNNACEQIKIDIGRFGKITLNLCKNCAPKFEDNYHI